MSLNYALRSDESQLLALERRRVAALYIALDRLHACRSRTEVLDAIADILTEVVEAEELAIFEVDRSEACLNLLHAVGNDCMPPHEVGFGEGVIGRVAASGRLFVDCGDAQQALVPWEETLSACIPLRAGGRLAGVIAVFALKLDKFGFNTTDADVFELLTRHAGAALRASAGRED